eukprot:m.25933 g.25933  ORF g.25933 m.25933 type:complete len:98 (+) comp29021_c0_seq1:1193-1486(+)
MVRLLHCAVNNNCIFIEKELLETILDDFLLVDAGLTLKFLEYHGFLASLSHQRWALVSCLPPDMEDSSWGKENDDLSASTSTFWVQSAFIRKSSTSC